MSGSPLDPALLKFPHVVSAREHAALRIDDLSARLRFGCKGPGAPSWLAANGYSVPESANSARLDSRGVLVARLATSEFLIEAIDGGTEAVSASLQQSGRPITPPGWHLSPQATSVNPSASLMSSPATSVNSPASPMGPPPMSVNPSASLMSPPATSVNSLASPMGPPPTSVNPPASPMSPSPTPTRPLDLYPVARQDLVVGIQGPSLHQLLRQVCSVDFAPLFEACGPHDGPVALTSMIGVGIVAWPRRTDSGSSLTVWLDPSFAHYFWTTLLEVGRGVGPLVIGSNTI